jgi:ribosomal protein S18 acetylase RimI-like enzyme
MARIRPAVDADAAALAALAERTFRAAFEADNTDADMAAHVAHSYAPARQAAEIADPALATLVAEHEGGLIAYAQLRRGPVPGCVTGRDAVEVWRFYVDQAWHGRGLARALMRAAAETAAAGDARTVWLGVWERNPRAIAFYGKAGFTTVGDQVFLLGRDAQRDLVMAAPVEVVLRATTAADDASPGASAASRSSPAEGPAPPAVRRR